MRLGLKQAGRERLLPELRDVESEAWRFAVALHDAAAVLELRLR